MKNKKITVTIAIPAYNEEKNIEKLLRSILLQKQDLFILKEILVNIDGCTDATYKEAKRIKNKKVIIFNNKERKGKPQRLNELFKKAKGDVIVLLDADIRIDSPKTIAYLIKPFYKGKNIGLIGGNPQPVTPNSFIAKAIALTVYAYIPLRNAIRKGKNPFACDGHILALSKNFARRITVPQNMIGTDSYLYFKCLLEGFSFQFVPEAIVRYTLPNTIKDHIKQNTRFVAAAYLHLSIFGDLVKREYTIPKKVFFKLTIKESIKKPIHALCIFLLNRYTRFKAKQTFDTQSALWSVAMSTKEIINYEK